MARSSGNKDDGQEKKVTPRKSRAKKVEDVKDEVAKPARKPRAKKAEVDVAKDTAKPARKPRTKKVAEPVAEEKSVSKKPAAKKPAAKKPVAKKPVDKKPVAKKVEDTVEEAVKPARKPRAKKAADPIVEEVTAGEILRESLDEIMGDRFGRYSKYIIQDRALPDARDGLKPVQRRILYSMNEDGNRSDKAHRKSAKSVGAILGNYHPHGDSSVYEAMVRMSQDWKMRKPLIDMHGNNGSIDGDSAAAMRYCVTGDTLVLTDRGLVRMDEIVADSELNSDTDISITVESVDGTNTASKFFNSGKHKTIKVGLQNGYGIEGSLNHPVLTIYKDVDGAPAFRWVLLENLKTEDKVVLHRGINQIESSEDLVSARVAAFLGLLISEGYVSGKDQRYRRVGFSNTDINLVDFVEELLKNEFSEYVGVISRNKNGSTEDVSVNTSSFYDLVTNEFEFSPTSHDKVIPRVILQSSRKIQREFLRNLFEGDGSVYYNEEGSSCVSYTSYSKDLITQLQSLLLTFGVVTSRNKDNTGERLIIRGYDNIKNFRDNIGFVSKRKSNVLEGLIDYYKINTGRSNIDYVPFISEFIRNKYGNNGRLSRINIDRRNKFNNRKGEIQSLIAPEDFEFLNSWMDKEFIYLDVVSIEESEEEKVVYSIKVDSDCHSFVANGIVNHNTESRLSKTAEFLLQDINKETVDLVFNFDDTTTEPTVLPATYPNLLVNGSTGISAGYATDIPPHNVGEVIDGVLMLIDKPNSTSKDLMECVKGPDFPGGGIMQGVEGLLKAYETGKGSVELRSRVEIEAAKNGKVSLVITEIPYDVNKASLVAEIDQIRLDKDVDGIINVRDETGREGLRIVVELRKDADADMILKYLYKKTKLQTKYNFNMVAIYNRAPKQMALLDFFTAFLNHRVEVIKRRSAFDLEKSKKRQHIVEGLVKAVGIMDDVIKIIKGSKSKADSKAKLVSMFEFSELQAEAIVTLQLYRLSTTDINELKKEEKELAKLIKTLEGILASKAKLMAVLKKELLEVREILADDRRTEIQQDVEDISIDLASLIVEEDVALCVTRDGYVKRSGMRSFNSSGGFEGVGLKDSDEAVLLTETKTTNTVVAFTNRGNYVFFPIHTLDDTKWKDVGRHISTYAQLEAGEFIVSAFDIEKFDENVFVTIIKDNGLMKRTPITEYVVQRYTKPYAGIKNKGDESVVGVWLTTGGGRVVITTEQGYGIHFGEDEVAPKGIKADGMRGIDLREGDRVAFADVVKFKKDVTALEDTIGTVSEYPRGRKGNKVKPPRKRASK